MSFLLPKVLCPVCKNNYLHLVSDSLVVCVNPSCLIFDIYFFGIDELNKIFGGI